MANSFEEWYKGLGTVTRIWATAAFLATVFTTLEFLHPLQFIYKWPFIYYKYQIWRLFSCFIYFGKFGIDWMFHMFALVKYCRLLEDSSFRNRSADMVWMIIFGGTLMLVAATFMDLMLLGSSLVFMLLYVWGRRNPSVRMSFYGLFTFTAPYLPWVLLGFAIMIGGSPKVDLLGICVGHLYYFLEDIYPAAGGPRLLKTPSILYRLMPPTETTNVHRFNEDETNTGGHPQVQQQQGLRYRWGTGQRLGDR